VASKLCETNIGLNKLAGEVISINGDAAEIINNQLINKSDRTLMLLPERSDEFLESAINTTKKGGIIEEHYLQITPVQSEILFSKIVRAVGPRYYQTVVDVKIFK
jgi:tRNA (guanine37-N1)-methyltransferase